MPPTPRPTLADRALENLVHQFARPMDALRELVQNALDSGSPRVDVRIGAAPLPQDASKALITLGIHDTGEGMDEQIIDTRLTRLFASDKAGDLTRIGRFGIGFSSIFALEPLAVLVQTGRLGESWELLFYPDRGFDKVRLDEPLTGTRITLFLKKRVDEIEPFLHEVRETLIHWCGYSDRPIRFFDQTRPSTSPSTASDDPFQIGDPEESYELLNRPFALPDALSTYEVQTARAHLLVGVSEQPHITFLGGGLTLATSERHEVLGPYADSLRGLSLIVRADGLEQTLTRCGVMHTTHFADVMDEVVEAAGTFRAQLLTEVSEASELGGDLSRWFSPLRYLVRAAPGRGEAWRQICSIPLFPGHDRLISALELERQRGRAGGLLLHPGDGPLADALDAEGYVQVRATPDALELLYELHRPTFGQGRPPRSELFVRADERFALPQTLDLASLPPAESALFQSCQGTVSVATQDRVFLTFGRVASTGPRTPLVLRGARGGRLFAVVEPGLFGAMWEWVTRRTLLVNVDHPLAQRAAIAAWSTPRAASLALAYAVLQQDPDHHDALNDILNLGAS
ncbi:MAG: hypothetical protein EA397_19620 [Deltaproteobacteria bacterium]|nr:MAG: hypothetical protein EA397_19620 [Deltaproteobacteria bacterium]